MTSGEQPRSLRARAARLTSSVQVAVQTRRRRGIERATAFVGQLPGPVRTGVRLTERTVRDAAGDRVPGLAAEATMFTLISLPALLLALIGSLGYVAAQLGQDGADQLDRVVFEVPRTFLTDSTYESYEPLAQQIVSTGRADVIGVGLLLALWTGSRATSRGLETLVIVYDIESHRAGWKRRLLALALTLGALVGAVTVLPLLVMGPRLIEQIAPQSVEPVTLTLLSALYWPVLGLLVLIGLTTFYHVGAPWHTSWLRDLPGAVLSMLLWVLSAAGLRAYLALTACSQSPRSSA